MPGKRITDLQLTKDKTVRGEHSQEAAAAKTGISVASARRVEAATVLPSQRPQRHWRIRTDHQAKSLGVMPSAPSAIPQALRKTAPNTRQRVADEGAFQRTWPVLVTMEMTDTPWRVMFTRTTGVCPCGAQLLPRGWRRLSRCATSAA